MVSALSFKKQLNETFTFISGKEDIIAEIKSLELGKDILLDSTLVPKRQMNEQISLSENKSVRLQIKTSKCSFKTYNSLKKGALKISILSVQNLQKVSPEKRLIDTYCKLFINDNQLYRTKTVKKSLNPVFNESVNVVLDKRYDNLKIVVQNWLQFEPSVLLGVVETPLYFLEEGKWIHKLRLIDPTDNSILDAFVECEFEFSYSNLPAVRKRKNLFKLPLSNLFS